MPVINWVVQDPTDLIIAGELLRMNSIANNVEAIELGPILSKQSDVFSSQCSPLLLDQIATETMVDGLQDYSPRHPDYTPYHCRLRDPFAKTMIAANAVVATPTGTLWPMNAGASGILIGNFPQATSLWSITGVTRDSAGSVLGNCQVTVMETGRMNLPDSTVPTPVVAATVSDGSGNYSVQVPMNVAYQVLSYKSGSPDVAGTSVNTLAPSQA